MIIYKEMIVYNSHIIEFGIHIDELKSIIPNMDIITFKNLTYCTITESIFGLSSECTFIFKNNKLIQLKFLPIIQEYKQILKEFNIATLNECFENAYVYLSSAFENNRSFICIYKDNYKSCYTSTNLSININYNDKNETVIMTINTI